QWMPAVPYFRLLCVIGIMYPLNAYNLMIVNVKGRSDLFLKLAIVKRSFTILGIILAVPYGIWPLISFEAASAIFMYFINGYFSAKFIHYPIVEQLKDVFAIFSLGILTGLVVFFVDRAILNLPDILRLIIGGIIGVGLYWLAAKFF